MLEQWATIEKYRQLLRMCQKKHKKDGCSDCENCMINPKWFHQQGTVDSRQLLHDHWLLQQEDHQDNQEKAFEWWTRGFVAVWVFCAMLAVLMLTIAWQNKNRQEHKTPEGPMIDLLIREARTVNVYDINKDGEINCIDWAVCVRETLRKHTWRVELIYMNNPYTDAHLALALPFSSGRYAAFDAKAIIHKDSRFNISQVHNIPDGRWTGWIAEPCWKWTGKVDSYGRPLGYYDTRIPLSSLKVVEFPRDEIPIVP